MTAGDPIKLQDTDSRIRIKDTIEQMSYSLLTDSGIESREADSDFVYPVDKTFSLFTDKIVLENGYGVTVRLTDHTYIATVENYQDWNLDLEPGKYVIQLDTPIKTYLRFDSSLGIEVDDSRITFDFGELTTVIAGVRSRHRHPESTIETTRDVQDMMLAFSYLSSSHKTETCERSWPTLRGHPPRIELSKSFDVPGGLEKPDTGIMFELPEKLEYLYPAAPLIFYLCADVSPGKEPRIVTDRGFEYRFPNSPSEFEREVEEVLRTVFLMDCVTRSEGLHQVNLHERNVVDEKFDIDFEELYDLSVSEQFETYLGLDSSKLPEMTWKTSSYLPPQENAVETIPFLVDDLSFIRTQKRAVGDGGSIELQTPTFETNQHAMWETWFGEDAPERSSRIVPEAFENRLDVEPSDKIEIGVVCNDSEMSPEVAEVEDVYGTKEELDFDVEIHEGLSTDELATVLESDLDFLHFVGHMDDNGFRCSDGVLDVSNLLEVGVYSFMLNGCKSYSQGIEMIKRGSVGGVVSLDELGYSGGVRVGKTLARLLNQGFPLRPALDLAKQNSVFGSSYLVIGDGDVSISQNEDNIPHLNDIISTGCNIETGEEWYDLEIEMYPTRIFRLGSTYFPHIPSNTERYLASGKTDNFRLSKSELEDYLEESPVRSWFGF